MTTREQDRFIERMSEQFGSAAVSPGYTEGMVRVTVPNGHCWMVTSMGDPIDAGVDFSVQDPDNCFKYQFGHAKVMA